MILITQEELNRLKIELQSIAKELGYDYINTALRKNLKCTRKGIPYGIVYGVVSLRLGSLILAYETVLCMDDTPLDIIPDEMLHYYFITNLIEDLRFEGIESIITGFKYNNCWEEDKWKLLE